MDFNWENEIYNYINSKDISRYLREINYKFNTMETAWLIYHSDKLSMTERHAEWLKLMDLMPDCEVPKRRGCRYWSSLFELIREYMAIEDKYHENILYGAEEEGEVLSAFDGMWFDFPTPFKKGDILVRQDLHGQGAPFILNDLITWDCSKRIRDEGDNTDMCAGIIGLNEGEGTLYDECESNYMDFEYYEEPLIGEKRLLKPISSLMKGEINVPLAFNAFRKIMLEESAKENWMREWFGQEAYKAAGLEEQ